MGKNSIKGTTWTKDQGIIKQSVIKLCSDISWIGKRISMFFNIRKKERITLILNMNLKDIAKDARK